MAATRLSYSAGFTRNLGDFNSLRIDVGIEEDKREGETQSELWQRVVDYVDKRLMEQVAEVESQLRKEIAETAELRKKK